MVRGNIRGGRTGARVGMRGTFTKKTSFIPRHPFDLNVIEHSVHFPRVASNPAPDDTALLNALTKRNQDLTPTDKEQQALNNLLNKVTTVLDNLVVAPGDFDKCQLEEVRQVGSYKKGTMRTGKNIADVVVIFKTIPTKESIEALSKKVEELLKESMKTEVISKTEMITVQITEKGFDIFNWQARVCILIATVPPNIRKVENPEMQKHLVNSLSAIRHIRFFEENSNSSVKVLIRILRDIATRFEAFSVMNPWMIELLANFAILSNANRQALSINQAFRRVFQLLASGLFLPGSSGLLDPCENVPVRVHTCLTLEQQDNLCMTAQTLLRVLKHGGYKVILGIDKKENLIAEMSVFDGVVISPLKLAYEPQTDAEKQNEDDDMDTDNLEDSME
jgi:interleukin enhancer-binding factor 2